jgi:hypothetical protein
MAAKSWTDSRADIARVRREIAKAKRVFLMLPHDYHEGAYGEYVRVSKAVAGKVVGMRAEDADNFDLQWEGGDLYIPPAYREDTT